MIARMDRPRSQAIEACVGLPVLQRPPRLTLTFVCQCEVVVCVSISGCQLYSCAIGRNGIVYATRFVKHVTQIEIRQSVTRVGFNREPVMLFGRNKILAVVIKRAEVDMRGCVALARIAAP